MLSDLDPIIQLRTPSKGHKQRRNPPTSHKPKIQQQVAFDRVELNNILSVYGRNVATGEWRDYAINFGRDRAVFSIYKRASECPLFKIEKDPKLARKQGAFSVVDQSGRTIKRGAELSQVLKVFDKKPRLSLV